VRSGWYGWWTSLRPPGFEPGALVDGLPAAELWRKNDVMLTRPSRLALVFLCSVSAASAQGIYAKAIEKAHKVADQESYGGQVSFSDGVAKFLELSLTEAAATVPPPFVMSAGFTKLAEPLRAAGKGAAADALTGILNKLVTDVVPQAVDAVRGASGTVALDDLASLRASRTALVDTLRKSAEPKIKEQLRPLVQQAAESAGLPAAMDAFIAVSGARIPDTKVALAALADQVVNQALDHVFKYLERQERAFRNDPSQANDPFVKAAFNMLR